MGRSPRYPISVGGRAVCVDGPNGAVSCTRQWPAGYFETAFNGDRVIVSIGEGEASYKGQRRWRAAQYLRKPAAGLVAIDGLRDDAHTIRLDVISGLNRSPRRSSASLRRKAWRRQRCRNARGKSNSSATFAHRRLRQHLRHAAMHRRRVWDKTDTSQSYGALLGARLNADYRVNAISGRGVVRNYNGFIGDSLPQAYEYTLFNHDTRADDANWRPDTIVIALGGNDFPAPLNDGERWADRAALHADYASSYAAFLTRLRAQHPQAQIVVWTLDQAGGETESQVGPMVARLQSEGFQRLTYAPLRDLSMNACNWHPNLADDRVIADHVAAAIAAGR